MVAREAVQLAIGAVCRAIPAVAPHLSFRDSQTLALWLSPRAPAVGRLELASRGAVAARVAIELRYGLIRVEPSAGGPRLPGPAVRFVPDGAAVRWGGWEIAGRVEEAGEGLAAGGELEERLDADRVASLGELSLRSRRPGDRFWPLGAPGRKKLKELFREGRVHPADRARVPLLAAGGEVLWVVGHRIGHPYRVEPGTRRVLVLRARRIAPDDRPLT